MGFWVAVQFLTTFPVPWLREVNKKEVGSSLSYFPVVGLGIGAILMGLDYSLRFLLPVLVVNALLIVALVILTGAHHLDGFIDTCDGVIAGRSPEERLTIMSDSRTGAFGVIGAFLLLLVKYVALASLSVKLRMPALVLMPALSRWAMVGAIFPFAYAKRSGVGLAFKQGARWYRLAIATAIALIVSLALLKMGGLVVMLSLAVIIMGVAAYLNSRLGGLTGDSYGAINEVTEVVFLILLILFSRWL